MAIRLAAGASVILRARLASTKALSSDEKIDDVLISLTTQVQIIHPLPSNPSIFTYLSQQGADVPDTTRPA